MEKGIAPPATTNYSIVDGQVILPPTANERKGIQPVVTVKANGGERAEVKAGQTFHLTAVIEVPSRTGKIIAAEWDFLGEGDFAVTQTINHSNANASRTRVTLKTSYIFSEPGTYFPTLRAVSQREGDFQTPFARIQNLERVRVVVH